jgi:hypothetical protein
MLPSAAAGVVVIAVGKRVVTGRGAVTTEAAAATAVWRLIQETETTLTKAGAVERLEARQK